MLQHCLDGKIHSQQRQRMTWFWWSWSCESCLHRLIKCMFIFSIGDFSHFLCFFFAGWFFGPPSAGLFLEALACWVRLAVVEMELTFPIASLAAAFTTTVPRHCLLDGLATVCSASGTVMEVRAHFKLEVFGWLLLFLLRFLIALVQLFEKLYLPPPVIKVL